MRARRLTTLALSIGCWILLAGLGSAASFGSDDIPDGIALQAGEVVPEAGHFWNNANALRLVQTFAEAELDLEAAEAKIRTLGARIGALEAELKAAAADTRVAVLSTEVERLKCPTWAERHIGWTIGAGVGYGSDGADAFVGALYGWRP